MKKNPQHSALKKESALSRVLSWLIWLSVSLIVWQLAAQMIERPLILPAPFEVLSEMAVLPAERSFWVATGLSVLRTALGLALSMAFALGLSVVCLQVKWVWSFVSKTVIVIQTIPMIALIILFLFWTTREIAIQLVIFFLLFPIFIDRLMLILKSIQSRMRPLLLFYPNRTLIQIVKVYFPQMKADLGGMLEDGWSLGLKSCVMAEVLASLTNGIGVQIQTNRLFLNISGVLAWTLWLILISFLIRGLIALIARRREGA